MENIETIGKNLLIINKYTKIYIKNQMKDYNLNYSEFMTLLNFYRKDGICPENIVEDLQHDKSLITRITSALEEKGFLTRAKNSADNRSINFYLTDKAKQIKPQIFAILDAWQNQLMNNIPAENWEIIRQSLQTMVKNIAPQK